MAGTHSISSSLLKSCTRPSIIIIIFIICQQYIGFSTWRMQAEMAAQSYTTHSSKYPGWQRPRSPGPVVISLPVSDDDRLSMGSYYERHSFIWPVPLTVPPSHTQRFVAEVHPLLWPYVSRKMRSMMSIMIPKAKFLEFVCSKDRFAAYADYMTQPPCAEVKFMTANNHGKFE